MSINQYRFFYFLLLYLNCNWFQRGSNAVAERLKAKQHLSRISDEIYSHYNYFNHSLDKQITQMIDAVGEQRALNCVPMVKLFQVRVRLPLGRGEKIALTGDQEQLGRWQVDKSLDMKRYIADPTLWYRKVYICVNVRIYYRYIIYREDHKGRKQIRYWEGQQHARVVEAYELTRLLDSIEFGDAHALGLPAEDGWLRHEYIIQFQFIWRHHLQFLSYISYGNIGEEFFIELKPCENSFCSIFSEKKEEDLKLSQIIYSNKKSFRRNVQENHRIRYRVGKILIIQLMISNDIRYDYHISITSTINSDNLLAIAFIPQTALTGSYGVLQIPLVAPKSSYWHIGWLTLPYLIIRPLSTALQLNFRTSFQHYWPDNWPIMNIRVHDTVPFSATPTPTSYYNSISEQTLRGFLRTQQQQYFQMIKFNVHLTKDNVAIVWPENGFFTASPHQQVNNRFDLVFIYFSDISYSQLLQRRIFTVTTDIIVEITYLNGEYVSKLDRLFPTLIDIFNYLPKTFGQLIEVEWPIKAPSSIDKNNYIDTILTIAHEHGCGRPLIFVSTSADICTMISIKQHIFPILLNINDNSNYNRDARLHGSANIYQFIENHGILGLLISSSNRQYQLHQFYKNDELLSDIVKFIYWPNNKYINDEINLKRYRVAGVLFRLSTIAKLSSITSLDAPRFSTHFFNASELREIFIRQCVAAGNLTLTEHEPDTRSPFWPRLRTTNESQ